MNATDVDKAYEKAILSKLSYDTPDELTRKNLENIKSSMGFGERKFTDNEIDYILNNFILIDSIDKGGLQACWVNKKDENGNPTQEIIYAIAGTDGYDDYYADAQIGVYGLAIDQFIISYNYFLEKTSIAEVIKDGNGIDRYYIKQLKETHIKPDNVDYIKSEGSLYNAYYYMEYKEVEANRKVINGNISLTGHSLGGHLAGLISKFTGLEANVFNAPGYHGFSLNGILGFFKDFNLPGVPDKNLSFYKNEENSVIEGFSYVELFSKLFGFDYGNHLVNQLINSEGDDFTSNLFNDWENTDFIRCINHYPGYVEAHSINSIINSIYAYNIIKDFLVDGGECFFDKESIIGPHNAFKNIVKLYYMNNSDIEEPEKIDYENVVFMQKLISDIERWANNEISMNRGLIYVDIDKDTLPPSLLKGSSGNDIIYSGAGENTAEGCTGSDKYFYSKESGHLIIQENSFDKTDIDKIKFASGISKRDATFVRENNNLIIYIKNQNNNEPCITIKDFFYNVNYQSIEQFEFEDGYLKKITYRTQNNVIYGSSFGEEIIFDNPNGSKHIYAGKGNDIIKVGSGKHIINLGGGKNYLDISSGSGTIYCNKNNEDTIRLKDIKEGSSVTIYGFSSYTNLSIEDINGYNRKIEIYRKVGNDVIFEIHNGGNIILKDAAKYYNFYGENIIYNILDGCYDNSSQNVAARGLNDFVTSGEKLCDHPNHGSPDRIFYPEEKYIPEQNIENDHPVPDPSIPVDPDDINGTKIKDGVLTYKSNSGIHEINSDDGLQKIVFDEGVRKEDICFEVNSNKLIMTMRNNSEQAIILNDFFSAADNYTSMSLNFGNDVAVDVKSLQFISNLNNLATITGKADADIIFAGDKNNTINSGAGDDIVYAGGGNDTINAGDGDDILVGGLGNDILKGGNGEDTYIYNLGDGFDTITETSGNDKIVFGEGIKFEDLSFRFLFVNGVQDALIITINGDETQGIRINGFFRYNGSINEKIETLEFADGSTYSLIDNKIVLNQTSAAETIIGTIGDDIIYGNGGNDDIKTYGGNDYVDGGDGNDFINTYEGNNILIGGLGNDTLAGGSGDDTYIYNLGDGFDIIKETSGNDKIVFGEGITFEDLNFRHSLVGTNNISLLITIKGDEKQAIRINNFLNDGTNTIERLEFADGRYFEFANNRLVLNHTDAAEMIYASNKDDIIYGNGGNDTIYALDGDDYIDGGLGADRIGGGKGNDTIVGGLGDDLLWGDDGDDTYIYNLGDGLDTITETSGNDKIVFGEGISKDDLTFRIVGRDLLIFISGNIKEGVQIKNFFNGDGLKVENIEFADGSNMDISTHNFIIRQSEAADNILGSDYNDTIYSGAGNDTVKGGKGNDILAGYLGDDALYGDEGDDVLFGEQGNDKLFGGVGDDTYVYRLGDGLDTITETSGNDKIEFKGDITFENLVFKKVNNNLYIYNKTATGEQNIINIVNHFYSENNRVEELHFADGSIYQYNNGEYIANQLIQAMGAFGATSSSISDISIDELNVVDNLIATNHINKVA